MVQELYKNFKQNEKNEEIFNSRFSFHSLTNLEMADSSDDFFNFKVNCAIARWIHRILYLSLKCTTWFHFPQRFNFSFYFFQSIKFWLVSSCFYFPFSFFSLRGKLYRLILLSCSFYFCVFFMETCWIPTHVSNYFYSSLSLYKEKGKEY